MKHKILLFIIIISCCSCGRYESFQNEATRNYSSAEMSKYAKYMVQGKTLYNTYCSNCHQIDGTGLGKVYPPLKQADYLLNDVERAICITKYGMEGEIIVNGTNYNQKMAGLSELTDLEIAEIITYITNSWGNVKGITKVNEVSQVLKSCQ